MIWRIVFGAIALLYIGGCTAGLVVISNRKPHAIVYCHGHVKSIEHRILDADIVNCGDGTFEEYRGAVEYR